MRIKITTTTYITTLFITAKHITDAFKVEKSKLVTIIKENKKMLNENVEHKTAEFINNSLLNLRNSSACFHFGNTLRLPKLSEFTLQYIERCFTTIVETNGFLQLDCIDMLKILSSSELQVSSELEVFSAANAWISYDFAGRKKDAENIFLKIRFLLLSRHALENILCNFSSFHKIEECKGLIDDILQNTKGFYETKSSSYYVHRYCSQNMYNISFVDYHRIHNKIELMKQVDGNNFENIKISIQFPENSNAIIAAAYLNGQIYIIGCSWNYKLYIQKYSLFTNTFTEPIEANLQHEPDTVCVCAFMQKIYVIGGYTLGGPSLATNDCTEFDVKSKEWGTIASMNERRRNLAAAAFEGRVFVSGGYEWNEGNPSNTVEVYDHVANMWSYMPNMIYGRCFHNLVPIRNKLFAFGGAKTCEVYDSCSNKFVKVKPLPPTFIFNQFRSNSISMGNKVHIFV